MRTVQPFCNVFDARKEDDGCKLLNAQEELSKRTALHFAVSYAVREKQDHATQPMPLSTTVFLIELGADRTLETANEKTAANVAADA